MAQQKPSSYLGDDGDHGGAPRGRRNAAAEPDRTLVETVVDGERGGSRVEALGWLTAEAALAEAAELIERAGAKTLAPALYEWRAELAAVLGDDATRAQLLREAQRGYDEIGAPLQAARIGRELSA